MRKITDQGTMAEPVAIVKEKGFRVGMHIAAKGKQPVEITAMENDSVTLLGPEGQAKVGLEEFLQITWKEQKPKKEAVPVEDWVTQAPEVSVEYFQTILRAKAVVCLHEFCQQHFAFHDRLDVFLKPRCVQANEDFKKHELILPPASTRLELKAKGEAGAAGAITMGNCEFWGDRFTVWILPQVVPAKDEKPGLLVPFWLVQTTSDPKTANMELVHPKKQTLALDKFPDTFQHMRNSKVIKAGEPLMLLVKKEKDEEQRCSKRPRTSK